MSTTETSAELLFRAADMIEAFATGASPGPWNGYITNEQGELFCGPRVDGYLTDTVMAWPEEGITEYGGQPSWKDLAWIALMKRIAAPLATWLRNESEMIGPNHRAVTLACALLNEPETEEWTA